MIISSYFMCVKVLLYMYVCMLMKSINCDLRLCRLVIIIEVTCKFN